MGVVVYHSVNPTMAASKYLYCMRARYASTTTLPLLMKSKVVGPLSWTWCLVGFGEDPF